MRRLFSTFASGWPGVGLFLMRVVAGGYLIVDGVARCQAGQTMEQVVLGLLAIGDGTLLVAGLWTPIAGPLAVALSIWGVLSQHDNPHPGILLATIGVALALVGPGAFSMDAWLFGWKRIDLEN